MTSGSARLCDRWRRGYAINGVDDIALHHLYRAMAFIGEGVEDQKNATFFAPRCTKDVIEERLFLLSRHRFSGLKMVFLDTTSIYLEYKDVIIHKTKGQRRLEISHFISLNREFIFPKKRKALHL